MTQFDVNGGKCNNNCDVCGCTVCILQQITGFCVNAAPVHDNVGKIMLFYKYDDSNLNSPCTLVSIIQEAVNDKVSVFWESCFGMCKHKITQHLDYLKLDSVFLKDLWEEASHNKTIKENIKTPHSH